MVNISGPMIIRQCDPSLEKQVEASFKETFWHLNKTKEASDAHAKHLEKAISDNTVLVAVEENNLLGFAFYHTFQDRETSRYIAWKLHYANPSNKRRTVNHYRSLAKRTRTLFEIQYYQNNFLSHWIDNPNDAYFGGNVVLAPYRRQGIGRSLTLERLRLVTNRGAKAIYVDISQHSPLRRMYEDLGFQPIVRLKPVSYDGSSTLFMGKILKT